ncbi:hypothetical protein [uncultured Muribaculum sp.]|uniref:hypothetical protein n=1 Tax=uncultured Muribaculum sp. TaxID=1918613 RepID=UPI00272F0563|nr:hypothetical protein [uncultured Muribaculum sp.]
MKPEEITKLAEEYAEDATKVMAGDPDLPASDLNGIKRDVAEYAEEVIRWLLRTHDIVKKSKMEEAEEVTIDGWVARNKDNSLYLFKAEPWYNSPRGYWDDHLMSIGCFSIPSESFPHITFDNSPIEITLTLKPKKK